MTLLDPHIAMVRAEHVLRRYPKFRSFCQAYRFDQHYLADLEIELELRRDAEERIRRVMRRIGPTAGDYIRALMEKELEGGQEEREGVEEDQAPGGPRFPGGRRRQWM